MKQINRADAVMLQVLSRVTPTPFRVDVTIDGRPVVMELDTGASVTLVNSTLWKRIGYPELSPPTVQLRSFTGHVISLKGEATVSVGCRGQLKQLRIRMANQPVVNIMGRDWIEAFGDADSLRMIFTRDASINSIGSGFQGKKIFDQFEALFKPELGHCTKIKAHLELKEGAVPVFRRPFPLAFAMHDAVEKELDRYVKMGILTPLDRSSWAAPVVTVKKPNSRIRICADFSTGLNDQLVIDSYPIPRPEDLCQALRGGITFTKLDLSDAYLQVELDDEYKNFDIEYRSTRDFGQADCLSRLPSSSDELFDAKFDQHGAEEDLTVKRLIVEMQAELPAGEALCLSEWPDRCPSKNLHDYFVRCTELSVSYGCLVWGIRTVIPTKLRSKILAKLHQTHPGRERMVLMARQFCWWPGMSKDIEMKVRSCEGCITAQKNPPKVAVRPWEVADGPWKRIHVDFANVNGEMFMVVVDAHSKWPEVVHMQRITAQQTIETLKTIFARFGYPEVLVSDNGTQFSASEFTAFCAENGIRQMTTAPYHPQSNGQVERFVETLKRALKNRLVTSGHRANVYMNF
ncbi:integrase core domain protein [Trichuris suis]|nr:integrase core domain protein [Trichuris suis]